MRAIKYDEATNTASAKVEIVCVPVNLREIGAHCVTSEEIIAATKDTCPVLAEARIDEEGLTLYLPAWQLVLWLTVPRQLAIWVAQTLPDPVFFSQLLEAGFRVSE